MESTGVWTFVKQRLKVSFVLKTVLIFKSFKTVSTLSLSPRIYGRYRVSVLSSFSVWFTALAFVLLKNVLVISSGQPFATNTLQRCSFFLVTLSPLHTFSALVLRITWFHSWFPDGGRTHSVDTDLCVSSFYRWRWSCDFLPSLPVHPGMVDDHSASFNLWIGWTFRGYLSGCGSFRVC